MTCKGSVQIKHAVDDGIDVTGDERVGAAFKAVQLLFFTMMVPAMKL